MKFNHVVLSTVLALSAFGIVGAVTTVNLGNSDGFAVLAGSTLTNTGSSVINGDLGLSPGTSVIGFPPGVVNGSKHVTDTLASQAQTDFTTAYNNVAFQGPASTVPTELGGTTKIAGIYNSASGTFGITGTLTLDAQGNPNAIFIFQTASTLITAGASEVVLVNGAQACNVFWKVGSSATLGTNSNFKGNILALTSATLTTGANVEGRVIAQNGAVTLDTNVITKATCALPPPLPVIQAPVSAPVVTPISNPISNPSTPVPSFPNTSTVPKEGSIPWNVVLPIGVFAIALLLVVRKKLVA